MLNLQERVLQMDIDEYCKYRGFIFNPSELCTTKDNRIIKCRSESNTKYMLEYICVHIPGHPLDTNIP